MQNWNTFNETDFTTDHILSQTRQHYNIYRWENKLFLISSQCEKWSMVSLIEGSLLFKPKAVKSWNWTQCFDWRQWKAILHMMAGIIHVTSSWVLSQRPPSPVVEMPETMLPWKIHHIILFASAVKSKVKLYWRACKAIFHKHFCSSYISLTFKKTYESMWINAVPSLKPLHSKIGK